MPTDETFGERYERQMREDFGEQRVHVMTTRVLPKDLRVGQYVMYLPLEITESLEMTPRMTRVVRVEASADGYNVWTELGVMNFRSHEEIQAVA